MLSLKDQFLVSCYSVLSLMSYYDLCNFAGGIDWRVPEELEGRNPGDAMELEVRIDKNADTS